MRILIGRLPKDIQAQVRSVILPTWAQIPHVHQRQGEKSVTPAMLADCLAKGRIIELNDEAGHLRALLRNIDGTCAVVSIAHQAVVTCYWNAPYDKHTTLNRSQYYWGQVHKSIYRQLGLDRLPKL